MKSHLPTFEGELHDVRLVNFLVDMDAVLPHVPHPLQVRDVNGQALVSMVDVHLKRMRAPSLGGWPTFSYRHIAFRLLVDDNMYTDGGEAKGIFFFKSFTSSPMIARSGSMLTDYLLTRANIAHPPSGDGLVLDQGNKKISYQLDRSKPQIDREWQSIIGAIDRAYAVRDGQVFMTKIQREKWPLVPVNCPVFATNFFPSAHLVAAYRVPEIIHYRWNRPTPVG